MPRKVSLFVIIVLCFKSPAAFAIDYNKVILDEIEKSVNGRHLKYTASYIIHNPASIIFPLFKAKSKTRWLKGWSYRDISGGEFEKGYVFSTQSLSGNSQQVIWVVSRYDQALNQIELYGTHSGGLMIAVTVKLTPLGSQNTIVTVSYDYTALTESGARRMESYSKDDYVQKISGWRDMMNAYFRKSH